MESAGIDEGVRPTAGGGAASRWRKTAAAVLGVGFTMAIGWGMVMVVGALEHEGECGSYGYGGYGCDIPATIDVEPDTDLVDRQVVTVNGSDFAPFTSFGAALCSAELIDQQLGTEACDLSNVLFTSTDGSGSVTGSLLVRRVILVGGTEIDCALEACVVGAATLTSDLTPIEAASAPVTFDPAVPPVPRLTLEITIDAVSADSVTGTATCNREAELFASVNLSQERGHRFAAAYGYLDEPVTCGPTPVTWTAPLYTEGSVLVGGAADYTVFGSAYDGVEGADTIVEGTTRITGPIRPRPETSAEPGEDVTVEVLGTTGSGADLEIQLRVLCDRAFEFGYTQVRVTQLAGLTEVYGFGYADLAGCSGEQLVSVPLEFVAGVLVGGPAEVDAFVDVYDTGPPAFFDSASATAPVTLSGQIRGELDVVEPDPSSRITIVDGTTTAIRLTVRCDGAEVVDLYVETQQTTGRTSTSGYGYRFADCIGDSVTVEVPIVEGAALRRGQVSVLAFAYGLDVIDPELPIYELIWEDDQAGVVRI